MRLLTRFELKHHHKVHIWRWSVFIFSLCILLAGLTLLWAANLKIPDFDSFEDRQVVQSTKIYDRTGDVLLYNMGEDIRRTVVPSDQISRNLKNATVAIEDTEFYLHKGIKPTAILRAVFANTAIFFGGAGLTQGGSTITQQVIKNTLLTQEKKISRKLKEWVLAIKLERVMDKDQILALYLNESPYGGNIYGVEEASQVFFGKPSTQLSLAESAYLAALPQAPTYYSPYGNHKEALDARQKLVLRRMVELKFITEEEANVAREDVVTFLPQNNFSIKAPHFVFYVKDYLEQKYGPELVERGGLKVITSLDWEMQRSTEEIVTEFAVINEKNNNAHNAGVIAMDPRTGEILVMMGSRDYFEDNDYGNYNVTIAKRQPGSSFKPFVYATAFKKGYTPDTVVFDLPTQFQTTCSPVVSESVAGKCYTPGNYDNIFRGPITFRDALAQSINIPAIKALYLAGIRDSLSTARDLGITTLAGADRYGLTLVLGGGEVTLLEMVNAYSVFANDGLYNKYVPVIKVEDSTGKVLEELTLSPRRSLEENIARQINDVLSDNVARAPSYGSNSPLNFEGQDVAIKTGTTNDYRDMWVVGYTPNLALGAWVGNNDNTSMEKKVAGLVVAPMWRKIIVAINKDRDITEFIPADYSYKNDLKVKPVLRGIWQGGDTYIVDKISGKLATPFTPDETKEERPIVNVHSILHWVNKTDPLGPARLNPEDDPQYIFWETPIKIWAAKNGYSSADTNIPTESDDVHLPQYAPSVNITDSGLPTVLNKDDRLTISFSVSQTMFPIEESEIYFNGIYVGTIKAPIYSFSFTPSAAGDIKPTNELRVVVYDTKRNEGSDIIFINFN